MKKFFIIIWLIFLIISSGIFYSINSINNSKNKISSCFSDDFTLLKSYRFPYPFLKVKIEEVKLTQRQDIKNTLKWCHNKYEESKNDKGNITDIYTYNMWIYWKSRIYFIYDKSWTLLKIDEFGSSIMIE